jgi:hypothetical protein
MQEESQTMNRLANDSYEHLQTFAEALETFNSQSQSSASDAYKVAELFMISLVKLDHAILKSDAYSMVMSNNPERAFPKHTECNFGKWYYGAGKEKYTNNPVFAQIAVPHEHVHTMVLNNKAFVEARTVFHPKNSPQVIANFKVMEDESQKLSLLLNKLIGYK